MPPGRSGVSRRAGTLATAATLALAATVLLTACACGSDDDEATDTSSTTTSTTEAPPTTMSVEDEVEAAYLAYRQMVSRLLEAPDPNDPEIQQRASGQNRDFLVDQLTTLQAAGHVLRFGENYQFSIISVAVDHDNSVVQDCTIDDASTVVAESGQVVSRGTSTELLQAELIRESGTWKVRTIESLETWAGITSCEQ